MHCAACNRAMLRPAGWLGNLPLGPICLARVHAAKPKRRQAVKADRVNENQLDLFGESHEPDC